MSYDYTTNLKRLARERQASIKAEAKVKQMEERLRTSPAYQKALGELNDRKAACNALDIDIRAAALLEYNGDKHPAKAVQIEDTHVITVSYDLVAARAWALTNLPIAIILDKAMFEKHAKAVAETQPVEGVTIADKVEQKCKIITSKLPEVEPIEELYELMGEPARVVKE